MTGNFWTYEDKLQVMAGSSIKPTIIEAIGIARERGEAFSFDFNDVTVTVEADSNPELIYRDWDRALHGYIDNRVGPKPKPELSVEDLESDAHIEDANRARREAMQAESQARAAAHRDRVEARMQNAPPMEFSDKAGWDAAVAANSSDPYSRGVITYAERWARMMQLEMSEGKTLDQVWRETSHEADLEGMSGFSQSAATHLLTQCWVHGKKLRRLHNASWGSSSTEGTVNPAVWSIGEPASGNATSGQGSSGGASEA